MIMKIMHRLQNVCIASKISILVSAAISIILFSVAITISMIECDIGDKYLYEYMAKVATDVFSTGIFLGLSGEFLAIIIDRRGK